MSMKSWLLAVLVALWCKRQVHVPGCERAHYGRCDVR